MEDRKRPASNDHDNVGPPLKRQATTVNGAGRSHPDADMPWQDDLEVSLIHNLNLDYLSPHSSLTTSRPCRDFRKRQYGVKCKNARGNAILSTLRTSSCAQTPNIMTNIFVLLMHGLLRSVGTESQ